MGSLVDELQRREAAARKEAGELRGQIAQLTGRLARVEERLSRLVIARETVDEVLREAGADVPPAAEPEVTGPPGPGRPPVTVALAVPPWRPGLEASALPQAYRDLLEVAEDAGRPLRAAQIAAAAGLTACELEDLLAERGREVQRQLLQDHLDLRAAREEQAAREHRPPAAGTDGITRTRLETGHGRLLASLFGTVQVTRCAWRRPGAPNLYPADVILG